MKRAICTTHGWQGDPCPYCADVRPSLVFTTWRQALADAQAQITHAYDPCARTMQAAYDSGLTFQQIAEATGLSPAGVQKIIGKQRHGTAKLDDPVFPVIETQTECDSRCNMRKGAKT